MTKIPAMREQRRPLWERCSGVCEITGAPLDYETFDMHHRRNKGMGGTRRRNVNDLDNLLALTPTIHNGDAHSVHQHPEWSMPRGYLLRNHVDRPGEHPVWLFERCWVLLTKGGAYFPLPPGYDPPAEV
jgi:hypothetical protein